MIMPPIQKNDDFETHSTIVRARLMRPPAETYETREPCTLLFYYSTAVAFVNLSLSYLRCAGYFTAHCMDHCQVARAFTFGA